MVARLLEHKKTVLAHVQALASKAEGGLRIRSMATFTWGRCW